MERRYTTMTLGSDGRIRDIGAREFVPPQVYVRSAWTQEIDPQTRKPIGLDVTALLHRTLYPHKVEEAPITIQ